MLAYAIETHRFGELNVAAQRIVMPSKRCTTSPKRSMLPGR